MLEEVTAYPARHRAAGPPHSPRPCALMPRRVDPGRTWPCSSGQTSPSQSTGDLPQQLTGWTGSPRTRRPLGRAQRRDARSRESLRLVAWVRVPRGSVLRTRASGLVLHIVHPRQGRVHHQRNVDRRHASVAIHPVIASPVRCRRLGARVRSTEPRGTRTPATRRVVSLSCIATGRPHADNGHKAHGLVGSVAGSVVYSAPRSSNQTVPGP
jgi:hypothetical protein